MFFQFGFPSKVANLLVVGATGMWFFTPFHVYFHMPHIKQW